jgi:hypothetical protein
MRKQPHTDTDDRPGSGWSALAAAIIADAIAHQDHALVDRPAFELLLEAAGTKIDPDTARAAIRARWKDRGGAANRC